MVLISIEQSGHFHTCQQYSGCCFICFDRPQKARELSFCATFFYRMYITQQDTHNCHNNSVHLFTWNNFNSIWNTFPLLACFVFGFRLFIHSNASAVRAWLGLIGHAEKCTWPYLPCITYSIITGKRRTMREMCLSFVMVCVFTFLCFIKHWIVLVLAECRLYICIWYCINSR